MNDGRFDPPVHGRHPASGPGGLRLLGLLANELAASMTKDTACGSTFGHRQHSVIGSFLAVVVDRSFQSDERVTLTSVFASGHLHLVFDPSRASINVALDLRLVDDATPVAVASPPPWK